MAEPYIEITGNGPHLRMWVRHRPVRPVVWRYGHHEPEMAMQYASQWVCDCGARGKLTSFRTVRAGNMIEPKQLEHIRVILASWIKHAKVHCTTRYHALTLYQIAREGRWPDGTAG